MCILAKLSISYTRTVQRKGWNTEDQKHLENKRRTHIIVASIKKQKLWIRSKTWYRWGDPQRHWANKPTVPSVPLINKRTASRNCKSNFILARERIFYVHSKDRCILQSYKSKLFRLHACTRRCIPARSTLTIHPSVESFLLDRDLLSPMPLRLAATRKTGCNGN